MREKSNYEQETLSNKNIMSYIKYCKKAMANQKALYNLESLNEELAEIYIVMKNVIYFDYYFKGIMDEREVKNLLGLSMKEFKLEEDSYTMLDQSMFMTLLNAHVELYYQMAVCVVNELEKLMEIESLKIIASKEVSVTVAAGISDRSFVSNITFEADELYKYLFSCYPLALDHPSMFRVINVYLHKGISIDEVSTILQMEHSECLQQIDIMNGNGINELSELLEIQQSKINQVFATVRVLCNIILNSEMQSALGVTYRKCIINDYQLVCETIGRLKTINKELSK